MPVFYQSFISRLEMYISSLKIHISSLKMCISSLEIDFFCLYGNYSCGQEKFLVVACKLYSKLTFDGFRRY